MVKSKDYFILQFTCPQKIIFILAALLPRSGYRTVLKSSIYGALHLIIKEWIDDFSLYDFWKIRLLLYIISQRTDPCRSISWRWWGGKIIRKISSCSTVIMELKQNRQSPEQYWRPGCKWFWKQLYKRTVCEIRIRKSVSPCIFSGHGVPSGFLSVNLCSLDLWAWERTNKMYFITSLC